VASPDGIALFVDEGYSSSQSINLRKSLRWKRHARRVIGHLCMEKHEPSGEETAMAWVAPIVEEICVGMEVTSYDSADLPVEF
jgi:coenzyme PQQ precursor peptide PqqA